MTQQVWNHQVYAPVGTTGYPQRPATGGLAIAALVLGVVSAFGSLLGVLLAVFAVFGAPAGVVGLVLGLVGRRKVQERQQQGAGMALAGIIIASVSLAIDLLLVAFFLVQLVILLL